MDKKIKDRIFCRFCLDFSIILYLFIIFLICLLLDLSTSVTFGLLIDCLAIDMLLRYKKMFSISILIMVGIFYMFYNKHHLNIEKPTFNNVLNIYERIEKYIAKEGI